MRTHIKDVFKLAPETGYGIEATSGFVSFNFVNDGSIELNEGLKDEKGIGGVVAYYGYIEPSLEVGGLLSVSDLSIIPYLFPADGLTARSFTIIAGNSDLGFGVKAIGSFPTEISLSGKAGEPVKYSVKFEAMKVVPNSSLPAPTTPDRTGIIMWHDGAVLFGENSFSLAEFKFDYKLPVHLEADISPKPSGAKRVRNLVAWGFPEISFSGKIYIPFTPYIAADTPAPIDIVVAIANMTIVLNDMLIVKRSFPVKGGDDLWVMDIEFKGNENSLSITID